MAGLLGPAAGAKFHAWRFALYAALLLSHSILSAQPIAREVAELCNYVKNGGFEEGDKLPATWARYPAKDENDNVQLRDTASAHTGQASGLIASVTPYTPGKPWMQWNQYGIAVEGGSTLIVSFWTKTAGVAPAHAGIHFYGEGRKHLGFVKIDGPKAADDWTHVRQNVPAPPDALTMGFVLYAAEKGKTWFDDAAAIGTPTTTAARATPTLDGKLTEPCWGEQNAITTFVAHTGDKLVTEKARAWLAFDDQNLYIAFRCPHPPGAKLRQQAKQHDGDTWLDDSIEVFLDPLHNHRDYVQLCVNSLGVIRDSRAKDTAWQSSARAAVQREDAAWTIELAIPYEPLGLGLDAGTTWGINLVWNNRVRGEVATWSLGGFHAPGRFGNVSLSPDLSRFFRADLAKRLDEKEREREAMRKELDAAELPARCLDEPLRRLGQAKAAIEALRRIADAAAPLPEGRWVAVRGKLADVSTMAADARRSAMNELFKVGQTGEKGDFRVAIAHSLQKIRRTGPLTDAPLIRRVRLDAARDEAESFQLVVLPNGQALKNVKVEAKPLTGPGGSVPLVWHRVGYVETAPPAYPTEYVGWWPDPLLPAGPFDVAADERQPLWFTAVVPPDAKPGDYTGAVTLTHAASAVSVPVELRVRNFRIPRPGTLPAAFSLYQGPWAKWWFGKEPQKMPVETFTRWCRFMGEYRLSPKNIAREYISHTKDDAGFRVDLSILKQTVEPLASKYFAPYSFNLVRLPSGPQIGKGAGKTSANDPTVAAGFVKAHVAEWKRLGLPDQVYIYGYDEPNPSHYPFLREAYRQVREVAPGYPIMQTIGDRNPTDLVGLVDIWCPLSASLESKFYAERRQAGDRLWTYVCCSPKPPHANFFVDEPATDHRVLFWQTRQAGATGFLYWSTCWWDGLPMPSASQPCFPDAPIRLSEHSTYKSYKTNGDGLLIYPGKDMTPLPSIRLEVIRDGIEDYEYLALLSRLVEKAKALPPAKRPAPQVLQQAEDLCLVPETISHSVTNYTKDPNVLFERRRQVGDVIERLASVLPPEP